MPKCNSNVHFGTRAYLFSPEEGLCYIFSTQNNCWEFLASDGVIFQNVIKPLFKTPVFGAPLTSYPTSCQAAYLCEKNPAFKKYPINI